jgi:hypothetical protein
MENRWTDRMTTDKNRKVAHSLAARRAGESCAGRASMLRVTDFFGIVKNAELAS